MVTLEKMRRLENGSSSSSQSDLDQEKERRLIKRNVRLDDFVSLDTGDSSSDELPSVPSFRIKRNGNSNETVSEHTEDLERTITPEEPMSTFSQLMECSQKTAGN